MAFCGLWDTDRNETSIKELVILCAEPDFPTSLYHSSY